MVDRQARRHWTAARPGPAQTCAADHRSAGDRGLERPPKPAEQAQGEPEPELKPQAAEAESSSEPSPQPAPPPERVGEAGFALGDCADLRRRGGGAGDRRRLAAGLARGADGVAGRAAGQCGRGRRTHHARCQPRSRRRASAAPAPIPRRRRGSTRWKNPSPHCAANSPPRARNRKSSRPPSTR